MLPAISCLLNLKDRGGKVSDFENKTNCELCLFLLVKPEPIRVTEIL